MTVTRWEANAQGRLILECTHGDTHVIWWHKKTGTDDTSVYEGREIEATARNTLTGELVDNVVTVDDSSDSTGPNMLVTIDTTPMAQNVEHDVVVKLVDGTPATIILATVTPEAP